MRRLGISLAVLVGTAWANSALALTMVATVTGVVYGVDNAGYFGNPNSTLHNVPFVATFEYGDDGVHFARIEIQGHVDVIAAETGAVEYHPWGEDHVDFVRLFALNQTQPIPIVSPGLVETVNAAQIVFMGDAPVPGSIYDPYHTLANPQVNQPAGSVDYFTRYYHDHGRFDPDGNGLAVVYYFLDAVPHSIEIHALGDDPAPLVTGGGRPYYSAPNPGAVPEPAAWALMIAGFGLVGSMARCARQRAGRRIGLR